MKRNAILRGLSVLLLAFVMTVIGCKDEKDEPQTFPAAKGKLTINGLGGFNDKYVYVNGVVAGSDVLLGLTDITGNSKDDVTYKLAKISGGKAEVPLYMVKNSSGLASYVAYDGNDNVTSLSIMILSESTLKSSNAVNAITNNLGIMRLMSGKFSNGNMTIDWGTGGGGSDNGSSLTIEMVTITGGTFTMGSPTTEPARDEDETQHSVTLNGFSMSKYPVTQEQYQAVMGTNPSNFKTAVSGESGTPGKLPVENVSWYDAIVFCNKLSMAKGLDPVYSISGSTDPAVWGTVPTDSNSTWNAAVMDKDENGYRLPTEAEWEYACRAGTTTAFNNSNNDYTNTALVGTVAWYYNNSSSKTHQVGLKTANAWGLYDMHGNVYEWCWDWYGNYSSSAQSDPVGAFPGSARVRRGGKWDFNGDNLRSAYRGYAPPYNRYSSCGFRLVHS
jgi:formylglycine-generating enzyme required for sulfatase activity